MSSDGLDDRASAILEGDYQIEGPQGDPMADDGPDVIASCRFCQEDFEDIVEESQHRCKERVELESGLQDVEKQFIEPHTHGVGAQMLFPADNMAPYWGLVAAWDTVVEKEAIEFQHAGETWEYLFKDHDSSASCGYHEGKLAPREQDTVDGGLNEYVVAVRKKGEDDQSEARRATFQMRPSYPYMKHVETGELIQSVPDELPEGIRIQVNASNVNLDEMQSLIQSTMAAIDVNPDYFTEIHDWSQIYNFEYYVRVLRSVTKRLTKEGGLFDRLAKLGSNSEGYGEYKWDNRETMGWRHAVMLSGDQWEKLIGSHHMGGRIKSYHPKHPRSEEGDDPLSYPKVEVQLIEGDTIPWQQRESYLAEMEEKLLNALGWANTTITLPKGDGPYIGDDYWEPTYSERDRVLAKDPTHQQIENEQDWALSQYLAADTTDAEEDVIQVILEQGTTHYEQVAEIAGRSVKTVYRAIEKLDAVIENNNGRVSFVDGIVREKIEGVFDRIDELAGWAQSTIDGLVEDVDALESQDSPLAKWVRAHGINVAAIGDQYEFDLSDLERSDYQIYQMLKEGFEAMKQSHFDQRRFVNADFRVRTEDRGEHVTGFQWLTDHYRIKGFAINHP